MIYCTVLTGSDREPAETFIEATSRFVCLPNLSDALLAVSVSRTAFMQLKIEDEIVLGVDVTPEAKHFKLLDLLMPKPKKPRRRFTWRRAPEPKVEPARVFTAVFRDGGAEDRVFATYEFHLVDAQVFDARYRNHFSLVEGTKQPALFTTDARSVETAKNCWNCEAPVKFGEICRNCGCNQDEHKD